MNPSTTKISPTRRSRPLTIGVAAGVLAGGAIGLVALSPAFTSAASDDTSASTAVVTPADDGAETQLPIGDRPEPGKRLRAMLQPLVDDGTIDATQADAVAEFLVENRPERMGGPRGRGGLDGHGPHRVAVAELLGIDTDTLRAELQAGKSIADIAEQQGVDVQTVVDGLVADAQSHLDLAVDHGLDEERAAERLDKLTERIETGVHRTRPADAPAADG